MIVNAAISTTTLTRVYPRRRLEDATPLRPPQEEGVEAVAAVYLRGDEKDPSQVIDYSRALRSRKRVGSTTKDEESNTLEKTAEKPEDEEKRGIDGRELPEEKHEEVQELERRDQEVRSHEQAHISAAGAYARGGMQLEYQMGPDGDQYAVGGHVSIDSGDEATPEKTIAKMQTVRAAAMAPAQPSTQDMAVAQRAATREQAARQELQAEKKEMAESETPENATPDAEKNDSPVLVKDAPVKENGMNAAAAKRGLKAYKQSSQGPSLERTAAFNIAI